MDGFERDLRGRIHNNSVCVNMGGIAKEVNKV